MNIALTDDHKLLTSSLAELLNRFDGIEAVTVYNSPAELLNGVVSASYDIIVLDMMLPGMNGIELMAALKARNVPSKILFLSSITEVPTVRQALRNGASGYLSKDCMPEELIDALTAIMAGDTYIGSSLQRSLIKRTLIEEQQVFTLSPREKEVLRLVCSGKTIKEAAYDMALSPHTVQSYHKSIMRKFNLHRSADLIVFAIKNGLYDVSPTL